MKKDLLSKLDAILLDAETITQEERELVIDAVESVIRKAARKAKKGGKVAPFLCQTN